MNGFPVRGGLMGRWKRFLLSLLYPGWREATRDGEGYTFVLPAPMDLPFLAYLALAALRQMDLRDCAEILVVPDAAAGAHEAGLEAALALAAPEVPVRLLPVPPRQRRAMAWFAGNVGVAHWAQIVEAIDAATTDTLFLHDADAFFTDSRQLAQRHREFLAGGYDALGVTARWDPAFTSEGREIPATWELLFSGRWARRWRPIDHKSGPRPTPRGRIDFDTMLYPQYMDHAGGRIAVRPAGAFLHLSGTIVTYRSFVGHPGRRVADEWFRLLLLSLLKEASPPLPGEDRLPGAEALATGLAQERAQVHYRFAGAAEAYREFRGFIGELVQAPVFARTRALMLERLAPFDRHFAERREEAPRPAPEGRLRAHGLGLD